VATHSGGREGGREGDLTIEIARVVARVDRYVLVALPELTLPFSIPSLSFVCYLEHYFAPATVNRSTPSSPKG
jgi:hypothetical protein